jgi:hypothetical protein
MSSFKGFAVLQRPADLVAKLEHDLERIRAAPDDAYAAFDFFVTADHILDWLLPDSPGRCQKDARKLKRESSELLKITSHIANGAKHFQALAKHHDSVGDLKQVSGGFDPRAFSPRSFSPASFKMHGLNVRLQNGRVIHVLVLAEDVLRYWQKEIGSP